MGSLLLRSHDWDFINEDVWETGISEDENATDIDRYMKDFKKEWYKAISDKKYREKHKHCADTYKKADDVDWDKYQDTRFVYDSYMCCLIRTNGIYVRYRMAEYDYCYREYYYDDYGERYARLQRSSIGRWYFRCNTGKRLYLDEFE